MTPTMVTLHPGQTTTIPGTSVEIHWLGDRPVTIYRNPDSGMWNISTLVGTHRILAYERLANRPEIGWWPLLPLVPRPAAVAARRP